MHYTPSVFVDVVNSMAKANRVRCTFPLQYEDFSGKKVSNFWTRRVKMREICKIANQSNISFSAWRQTTFGRTNRSELSSSYSWAQVCTLFLRHWWDINSLISDRRKHPLGSARKQNSCRRESNHCISAISPPSRLKLWLEQVSRSRSSSCHQSFRFPSSDLANWRVAPLWTMASFATFGNFSRCGCQIECQCRTLNWKRHCFLEDWLLLTARISPVFSLFMQHSTWHC